MVLEQDPIIFLEWFKHALFVFAIFLPFALALLLAIGLVACAVRYGPMRGGEIMFHAVVAAAADLWQARWSRTLALARLAVQESLRRRVWVGLVLFLMILVFAGWFLDPNSFDPAKLYLNFVLTATTYLSLLMALFLSVFSLPADMKNKTIYTIVTKPVRRSEIFMGRLLGFSAIGTGFLAVTGALGYGFVLTSIDHTHAIDAASLQPAANSTGGELDGQTSKDRGHFHRFRLDASGEGDTESDHGHSHHITRVAGSKSGEFKYVVGPAEEVFKARSPKYGDLAFRDRNGQPVARGISVGNEWTYRSFIEGNTAAAAIWTFHDVTPEQFPDGLDLEMTIRVFRSWKGVIERPIAGSLMVRNPKTGLTSNALIFRCKDALIDQKLFPRKLTDVRGNPIDLYNDLVTPEGNVEVVLHCIEPVQYFGVAKADLYLRAGEGWFGLNFLKGFVGIWFQMLLVTGFSLMFSTFLSAPVALMAEISTIVIGFCTQFILDLASPKNQGGGPFESLIRIPQQMNMTSPLEEGLTNTVVKFLDACVFFALQLCCSLLPDFRDFNNVDHVTFGFNIPIDNLLRQGVLSLTYLAVAVLAGTFVLKTREVAQ